MTRAVRFLWPVALLLVTAVAAQTSTSYDVEEHVLNAGGAPAEGVEPSSPSFRVTLASIGEAVAGIGSTGPSFAIDSSFAAAYPPPGEVSELSFADRITLAWAPEWSTGTYNLYRGQITGLAGLGYGSCIQQGIATETTTDDKPAPTGDGFFYLVTAANRLDEEGTKGLQSDGTERAGDVCP